MVLQLRPFLMALWLGSHAVSGVAQAPPPVTVPLAASNWTLKGEDLRFEEHLGRPSLYLGRGHAIAHDVALADGTIDFDMAATDASNFLGLMFHVQSSDAFEVVFFRFGASGTVDALQYQPSLNGSGTWQIFHGDEANAVATLRRHEWTHVKIEMQGTTASVHLGSETRPLITIPRLVLGDKAGSVGFWTGSFGKGGYFSNLRYAARPSSSTTPPVMRLAAGTIRDWEVSETFDAAALDPAVLPNLRTARWDRAEAEPWRATGDTRLGLVLINRLRRSPEINPPADGSVTMSGRAPGSKVVFARTVIDSDRDQLRRLHFGYSDGVVLYVNGTPLFFGMNPYPFRGLGGVMEDIGEAVYLPLHRGRNEIVLGVHEFFGGWGFWTRLDPPATGVSPAPAR